MKKTLLAITLAAAMAPFTFARPAQTGNPPAENQTKPAKKHKRVKKHKKAAQQQGSTATPAAPAAPQK